MVRKRRTATAATQDSGEKATTDKVAQKKNPTLFTTADRSRLMSRVRQKNTTPETTVRQIVHSLGFRFRTNGKGLPGSPDLVNRKSCWAVFVHGCYWHAHEGCRRWKIPTQNRSFWKQKFETNRKRDQKALEDLASLGYRALVIWQCELEDRDALTAKVLTFLKPSEKGVLSETYRFFEGTKKIARTVTVGNRTATTLCENHFTNDSIADPRSAYERSFLAGSYRVLPKQCEPPIRTADLFCGCGGLSLGVREACGAIGRPFLSALAVDHDPWALKVYQENFSPIQTSGESLEDILDQELGEPPSTREHLWLKAVGPIDILVAGPPCQGHSDLNNQTRRSDPRNRLYEKVGRFVELARPDHVLIENVPGVVHDKRGALSRTTRHLENLGYYIDEGVVDLSALGVPQKRKRHVLVASLVNSISIESALQRHEVPTRSVAWAIRDLEQLPPKRLLDSASRPSQENLKRIQYLLQSGKYDLPNSLRPACHRNDDHSYKSMYGRLSWDEPAQTITSGFGSPGQGRFLHPTQPRVLTPHEASRLQFFPDSFSFAGIAQRSHLAKMIGNAVPMKLSWAFTLEFLALTPAKQQEHIYNHHHRTTEKSY